MDQRIEDMTWECENLKLQILQQEEENEHELIQVSVSTLSIILVNNDNRDAKRSRCCNASVKQRKRRNPDGVGYSRYKCTLILKPIATEQEYLGLQKLNAEMQQQTVRKELEVEELLSELKRVNQLIEIQEKDNEIAQKGSVITHSIYRTSLSYQFQIITR